MPGVVGVAGVGAVQVDYPHAVFGNFPLMLAVSAVLTSLLLASAFRSLPQPAKAVLFNLISLAATFGAITWFWQHGHGSSPLFGIAPTSTITSWVPLMIFAFLFGLSMDYEVFILSLVREGAWRLMTGSQSHPAKARPNPLETAVQLPYTSIGGDGHDRSDQAPCQGQQAKPQVAGQGAS